MSAATLDILLVCTGNICRSPMAERLMASRLGERGAQRIRLVSAGTRAVEGHAMDAACADIVRDLGGDPTGHKAQQLVPYLVQHAGLILTASETHRSSIVRSHPASLRKTFTMREFVRLGSALTPPRPGPQGTQLHRQVELIAAQRGAGPAPRDGDDDIVDPLGAPVVEVRRCGLTVSEAVDGVLACLGVRLQSRAVDAGRSASALGPGNRNA